MGMPFIDKERWCTIEGRPTRGTKRGALFLDRDGVIIVEKHYLRDPDQVELYAGVVEKLRVLRHCNLPVIVVTNQSGIGQGMFEWSDYMRVHERLLHLLRMTQPFTAVYANSHHPSDIRAFWRKPNPGMILQAASDLDISLEASVMVGDKCVDLEAAMRAGIRHVVHVRTGHGETERPQVLNRYPRAQLVESLAELDLSCFESSQSAGVL
jgi:D-glycero-D-manno-heptose 1,7-bisphosphate phosphatase